MNPGVANLRPLQDRAGTIEWRDAPVPHPTLKLFSRKAGMRSLLTFDELTIVVRVTTQLFATYALRFFTDRLRSRLP